ncbi:MAG: hypothetical protein MK081_06565 [Flavobacteriales bacterium]|nr:hypothetical protein [Flavobacteriales bacterium]
MKTANIISYVLHPLWMPLFTLVLAYFLDPFIGLHPEMFKFLLLIVLINTIAPGLSILVMKRKGIISDLDIRNRRERLAPFLLFLFYYVLSYILLRFNTDIVPIDIFIIFFSLLISLVSGLLINSQTKISMHLMAIGGLCGVLAGLNELHLLGIGWVVAALLMGAGVLGWARIRMGVHTHQQVYLGFSVGFLIHFAFLYYRVFI